jgi:hypothetical protein
MVLISMLKHLSSRMLSQTGIKQQHHGRETLIGILLFLNRRMAGWMRCPSGLNRRMTRWMKCPSGWMTGRIQGKLLSSFTICNICLLGEGSYNSGLLLDGSLIFKDRTGGGTGQVHMDIWLVIIQKTHMDTYPLGITRNYFEIKFHAALMLGKETP